MKMLLTLSRAISRSHSALSSCVPVSQAKSAAPRLPVATPPMEPCPIGVDVLVDEGADAYAIDAEGAREGRDSRDGAGEGTHACGPKADGEAQASANSRVGARSAMFRLHPECGSDVQQQLPLQKMDGVLGGLAEEEVRCA
eukprot:1398091-Pleurochrysis_carterae.AAC.1